MRLISKFLRRASEDPIERDAQDLCEVLGGFLEEIYDADNDATRYRVKVNGAYIGYFRENYSYPHFYFYTSRDQSLDEAVEDWLTVNYYEFDTDCWCKYV